MLLLYDFNLNSSLFTPHRTHLVVFSYTFGMSVIAQTNTCLCSCPALPNLPCKCPQGECCSAVFYCFTTPCCLLLNSCPSYSNLPPECPLVTPPGECCGTPQCNFQGTGGTSTGTGTGTVTGGGTGTRMLIPRVFTWQNRQIF